eukprot:jgi/Pico_ML_1/52434/g3139.t1
MAHVDARRRAWTVEADARRSAESLFETRSVKEIRSIATRTEQDVERKQVELRHLIGSSYRDFVQSADTVVSMAETCMALVEDVGRIKASFRNLSDDVAAFVAKSPKSSDGHTG